MDFEVYKEQILERFETYKAQVQDSEVYIKLKEKYDTLSPNIQKAIKYGSAFLVVYFFYSIPAGYVSSAGEKIEFFEENRQLTRDLIRAGRVARTVQLPPPAPSGSVLKTEVENKLQSERILPDQRAGVDEATAIASKKLVSKEIRQSGVRARVKKVNLRQLINLGEAFNDINSTKLMNIAIQADSKDPHYFNVDYEVASFSVPQQPEPSNHSDKKSKSKSKSRKSRFKKPKGKKK